MRQQLADILVQVSPDMIVFLAVVRVDVSRVVAGRPSGGCTAAAAFCACIRFGALFYIFSLAQLLPLRVIFVSSGLGVAR